MASMSGDRGGSWLSKRGGFPGYTCFMRVLKSGEYLCRVSENVIRCSSSLIEFCSQVIINMKLRCVWRRCEEIYIVKSFSDFIPVTALQRTVASGAKRRGLLRGHDPSSGDVPRMVRNGVQLELQSPHVAVSVLTLPSSATLIAYFESYILWKAFSKQGTRDVTHSVGRTCGMQSVSARSDHVPCSSLTEGNQTEFFVLCPSFLVVTSFRLSTQNC
jgi:hypothetical protein